jgi:Ca2+-dependent lipid-binding protein
MRIQSINNFGSNKSPEKLIDGNDNFDTDESEVYKVLDMRNNSLETNYNKVVEISEAVKTPTTIAPTTTEETVKPSTTTTQSTQSTTTKEIDYILAIVTVNRATVPDKDPTPFNGVSDPFVDLYLDGIKIGSTNFIKDNNNPQWNYHFVHQIKLSVDSVIHFEIFDKDLTKNEYIGGLTVKISQLMADGLNGKITHQNYGSGSLWFTVSWTEVYKTY